MFLLKNTLVIEDERQIRTRSHYSELVLVGAVADDSTSSQSARSV